MQQRPPSVRAGRCRIARLHDVTATRLVHEAGGTWDRARRDTARSLSGRNPARRRQQRWQFGEARDCRAGPGRVGVAVRVVWTPLSRRRRAGSSPPAPVADVDALGGEGPCLRGLGSRVADLRPHHAARHSVTAAGRGRATAGTSPEIGPPRTPCRRVRRNRVAGHLVRLVERRDDPRGALCVLLDAEPECETGTGQRDQQAQRADRGVTHYACADDAADQQAEGECRNRDPVDVCGEHE